MNKQYVSYTPNEIDSDNAQNILVEMMARCLACGDRIIIEQAEKKGQKYIMVDFSPTDNSNHEYDYDGQHVCQISSVDTIDGNDYDEGKYYSNHTNYVDALNEVARIIREDGFTEMYVESY